MTTATEPPSGGSLVHPQAFRPESANDFGFYGPLLFPALSWVRRFWTNPIIWWSPVSVSAMRSVILLVAPVLAATARTGSIWGTFQWTIVSLLIALTDAIDGFLARYLKRETQIGGILDSFLDKVYVFAHYWYLWRLLLDLSPGWSAVVTAVFGLRLAVDLTRVAMTPIRSLLGYEIKANIWGKLKFHADLATIIVGFLVTAATYSGSISSNVAASVVVLFLAVGSCLGGKSIVVYWSTRVKIP